MITFRSECISSPGTIRLPTVASRSFEIQPDFIAVDGWWKRMLRNGIRSAIAKPSSSAATRFATIVIAMRQECGRRYGRSRL